MHIQLSDHFNTKRMLRFTFPSVIMMVVTSLYSIVDGFFVSNFVGKTPFAAVNFIMPVLMLLGVFGFMFGTGGSALIAKTLGEGNHERADGLFSMLVYVNIISGVLMAVLSIVFLPGITKMLGATGQMLSDCVVYGRIILATLPFLMMQYEFQSFFIAAEKPMLGLYMSVAAGVSNVVFDALFMVVFKWGIVGAALATAMSQLIGGIVPLVYFLRPNTSRLHLGKPVWDFKALLKTCTNGSSELMTNISMSVVGMLYNVQLMRFAGENGVAAYGVLMYVNFVFISVFIGFSTGIAPVFSYHYGAKNNAEIRGLFKRCICIIAVLSVAMLVLGEALAYPLSYMYTGYDADLMDMTLHGFVIFAFSFLFAGFAIFGSAFFTALNDGLTSALISFLRTLLFQTAAVLILPEIWGLDGIWYSVIFAEAMAVLLTVVFVFLKRKTARVCS